MTDMRDFRSTASGLVVAQQASDSLGVVDAAIVLDWQQQPAAESAGLSTRSMCLVALLTGFIVVAVFGLRSADGSTGDFPSLVELEPIQVVVPTPVKQPVEPIAVLQNETAEPPLVEPEVPAAWTIIELPTARP